MKTLLALLCIVSLASPTFAGPDHDHGPRTQPGPNGGRILAKFEPHVEFLVTPDRRVKLTFLDGAGKPVPAANQIASLITGDRMAPTRLTFVPAAGALLSEQTLPEGSAWPVVVEIRGSAESKPTRDKFNLDLAVCSGCSRPEYACTCGH